LHLRVGGRWIVQFVSSCFEHYIVLYCARRLFRNLRIF
jgi:hypothetical protein